MKNGSYYICILIFAFAINYSKAQKRRYGVTYIFPENRNCTKFDNAIIREGAKLAWSISGHGSSINSKNEHDEEFEMVLNRHNADVPYIRIVDYDLDLMEATLDVRLSAMNTFTTSNILKFRQGSDTRRGLSSYLIFDDGNSTRHRHLPQADCCHCNACMCCPLAVCTEKCDRRRRLRKSNDERRRLSRQAELLRDIAIPVFEMLHLHCVTPKDLMVVID